MGAKPQLSRNGTPLRLASETFAQIGDFKCAWTGPASAKAEHVDLKLPRIGKTMAGQD